MLRSVLPSLALAATLVAPFGSAAAAGGPPPASRPAAVPESPRTLQLAYQVYAGGLHIFDFDVDLSLKPDGYAIAAAGETRGMVGWIYRWTIRMAAEGAKQDGDLRPRRYDTVTDWQNQPKSMRLSFLPQGRYDVARVPPETADPNDEGELPARLPEDVVDPLSLAVIATRTLAETGRCDQALPVFDGKRRYDIRIADLGPGQVQRNRYSIYHGPAVRCRFAMERISGFSKKRRYSSQWDEETDAPPIVWMATVRDGFPPVPVRYEGAIALGSIVIHLTRAEARRDVAESPAR